MKKAYITGATGCVGQNVLEALLRHGWEVTALHRRSSDLSKLKGYPIRLREANFHDETSLREAIDSEADAMFHIAGNVSHWSHDEEVQWKDNVLATRLLAQVSLERKIRRFIFTSTGATSNYRYYDQEMAKTIPVPYVRTKRLSELELYQKAREGLDVVFINPIIVLGHYDYDNYSQVFQQICNRRFPIIFPGCINFCHAGDLAEAHVQAYESGRSCTHYTLAGPRASWLELCQIIARLANVKIPQRATPAWALRCIAFFLELTSHITKRRPALSSEVLDLLKDAPDFRYSDVQNVKNDLNYHPRDLVSTVTDQYQWMLSAGRLKNPD